MTPRHYFSWPWRLTAGHAIRCGFVLSAALGVGCSSDSMGGLTALPPGQLYTRLTFSDHAITMTPTPPYDTLQLTATSFSALGTPLTDTSTIQYAVLYNDTNVVISQTGLLRALRPDVGVVVLASRTIGEVTQIDTAVINVNAVDGPLPVFTTLQVAMQPDSTRTSITDNPTFPPIFRSFTFTATAWDAHGDSIPNSVLFLSNSNPEVFSADCVDFPGSCLGSPANYGQTRLSAEATIYGKRLRNSLVFTVGLPLHGYVNVGTVGQANQATAARYFIPGDDTIAVGGVVVWDNSSPYISGYSPEKIDIVFDDSTQVAAVDSATLASNYPDLGQIQQNPETGTNGNIPPFVDDTSLAQSGILILPIRRFPVAGTYHYHSRLTGATGVIHVLPEFQVPSLPAGS